MSEPFKRLMRRVDALERWQQSQRPSPAYTPEFARRNDQRIREALRDLACEWVPVRFGTVAQGSVVASSKTFAFDSSYPTGGEDFTRLDVPGVVLHVCSPAAGYTFEVDGVKIKAYSSAGTEVSNGTDLSGITTNVLGMGTDQGPHMLFRPCGEVVVTEVQVEVQSDVLKNSTNFWTLELLHRRDGETTGRTLGTYDTSDSGLASSTPAILWSDESGLAMTEDERLQIRWTENGNLEPLQGLIVWVKVHRRTR